MFRKSLRAVIKSVLWVVSKIVYRIKIEGKENIKDGEAYILCGNHIHAIDAPILIINMKRKMPFLAKDELFRVGIVRYLGNLFDMIPVKRGAGDTSSLKKSLKSIKNGEILGIFPEGTRNGLAKNVELKTGAASLALKTNTKILPLGIKGNFKLFSKIEYRFGEPMDFSQYASDKPGKDVLEKITLEVMDRVLELAK